MFFFWCESFGKSNGRSGDYVSGNMFVISLEGIKVNIREYEEIVFLIWFLESVFELLRGVGRFWSKEYMIVGLFKGIGKG